MAREISIIIRARNAMAAGIASASRSLQAFGASAMKIGKWFAAGFLAAGTAVVGFAVKALSAYAESEKATQQLSSALTAYGENASQIVPKLQAVASAIQDETGASDDATVATMGRLRLMGVETAQLGEAAKAVVSLKAKNVEGAQAERLVAAAISGNFDAFSKVIPKIKEASTEAEKAAMVNDFLTAGYQSQKDSLGTVAGQWGAFKERVGDAFEIVGESISQNAGLVSGLNQAGDAVKNLGIRFAEWASGGGITNAIATAKFMFEELKFGFEKTGAYVTIVASSIMDGFSSAFNYVANIGVKWKDQIVAQFSYVSDYIKAVWEKIKAPSSTFEPPSTQPMIDAMVAYKDSFTEWDTVTDRTDAAFQVLEKLNQDHADRVKAISDEQLAALSANADTRADKEEAAMERIEIAAENHADKMAAIMAQGAADGAKADLDRAKQAEAETKKQAEDSAEAATNAKRMFLDKDFRREEREKAKQEERDAKRMARALEQGRKGLKGAGITRAQEAEAARIKALETAEAAKFAEEDRAAREVALKESMDAVKVATEATSANTEKIAISQEKLNENLVG